MPEKIIMPQGGQDIREGRVVRWYKAEGDPIKKDEVICEVETEKAVFEVVAPFDGVLLKIVVPGGKIAKVLSTIAIVGQAGESLDGDEVESVGQDRQNKAAGIDMAALKKKVAARRKSKKENVKAFEKQYKDTYVKNKKIFAKVQRKFRKPELLVSKLIKDDYVKERVKKITSQSHNN